MKRIAFALLGPTASGKSPLAMRLAQSLPIEIVSVDSGQVYRGMDIGTAKPSKAERTRVPHHLIDLVEPTGCYSAARFRADAMRAIEEIFSKDKIPLLVGGTMLYYRTLAQGIDELPAANPSMRAAIDAEASKRGWPALHAELATVDPATARRLPPTDAQRIQRALEVYRVTGRPISGLQRGKKRPLPFGLKAFCIVPADRPELHRRIAERFDRMLDNGLVEEVQALRRRHALHARLPSMRCVGYRQVWDFLQETTNRTDMRERAIAATRQLAKRQITWLRSLPGLQPAERLAEALTRA